MNWPGVVIYEFSAVVCEVYTTKIAIPLGLDFVIISMKSFDSRLISMIFGARFANLLLIILSHHFG